MQNIELPRGTDVIIQIPERMLKKVIKELFEEFKEELKAEQSDPLAEYPDFLTTAQASEILQVGRATVTSYANDPLIQLDKLEVMGKLRFKKSEVLGLFKTSIKGQRLMR